jgi:hypothetical protein
MARDRRHPADVTADRLIEHYQQWFDSLTGSERDYIGLVINVLRDIAEGVRGPDPTPPRSGGDRRKAGR